MLPNKTPMVVVVLTMMASLAGCSTTARQQNDLIVDMPSDGWLRGGQSDADEVDWLSEFDNKSLNLSSLIADAQQNNFSLQRQQAVVDQSREALVITGADRWPAFTFSLRKIRRNNIGFGETSIIDLNDLSIDANWEIDLWGRLNKAQRAAKLRYEAQQAALLSQRRELAANTILAVFDVVEAKQLTKVITQQVDNVSESVAVVESGYRQGLNDALDLYLAQNSLQQEISNLAQQEQTVLESAALLQRQLGRYPSGTFDIDTQLPVIDSAISVGLPAELLTRRADIQQAWLSLLAADANAAAAHRQRFPRLSLAGGGGSSTSEISDLLDADNLVWSFVTSLSAPLFDGGRLRAQARQAQAAAREAEQIYLDTLYQSFLEVENAISQDDALGKQYDAFLLAEENAVAALDLALEQYQRGLVDYNTVLTSQTRAFDASATVIRLRNQKLKNRIALHLALGGTFNLEE